MYVHSASQVVSGGSAQSPNYTGGGASRAVRRFTSRRNDMQFARPEVHVTTDQFVVEDYRCGFRVFAGWVGADICGCRAG